MINSSYQRNRTKESLHFAVVYLMASLAFATAASAQSDLYWNPDDGGSGNWNSIDTSWSTNPAGPGNTAWSDDIAITDSARFDFSGGTITLEEALGAGELRFQVDGYVIDASGLTELQLNADREIHVAAGATAELGPNLRIMAPGSAGALGFEKTGAGTLIVNGPLGSNASEAYFGGGFGSANGRLISVAEGTLQVDSGSLSNTRNVIQVAAGASLVANNNLNLGGFSGGGSFSGDSSVIIRGVGEDFSGVISGDLSFRHLNAAGAQTFSGSQDNTFTGDIRVNNGVQIFAKDDNIIAMSGSQIWMDGGGSSVEVRWEGNEQVSLSTSLRFDGLTGGQNLVNLNGHSERMGDLLLDLSSPTTGQHLIDFGDNAISQYLWFSEFVVNDINAPAINIANFIEGQDSLRFDINPSSNLPWLKFWIDGDLIDSVTQFDAGNNYWVVAPIPEPNAYALLAAFFAARMLFLGKRGPTHGKS